MVKKRADRREERPRNSRVEPKPPDTVAKVEWVRRNWRTNKLILCVSCLSFVTATLVVGALSAPALIATFKPGDIKRIDDVGSKKLLDAANSLLDDFVAARDRLEKGESPDFQPLEIVIATMRNDDRGNGHALYFAGEIKRVQRPDLFTTKSCLKPLAAGEEIDLAMFQQDFLRYREELKTLSEKETGGDTGSRVCYGRPHGYCVQRTAWIAHLLANDFYQKAMAATDRSIRSQNLIRASGFIPEAKQYKRNEKQSGFDQCIDTLVLEQRIADQLKPSE